jgi:hypothetical protein
MHVTAGPPGATRSRQLIRRRASRPSRSWKFIGPVRLKPSPVTARAAPLGEVVLAVEHDQPPKVLGRQAGGRVHD